MISENKYVRESIDIMNFINFCYIISFSYLFTLSHQRFLSDIEDLYLLSFC